MGGKETVYRDRKSWTVVILKDIAFPNFGFQGPQLLWEVAVTRELCKQLHPLRQGWGRVHREQWQLQAGHESWWTDAYGDSLVMCTGQTASARKKLLCACAHSSFLSFLPFLWRSNKEFHHLWARERLINKYTIIKPLYLFISSFHFHGIELWQLGKYYHPYFTSEKNEAKEIYGLPKITR